MVEFLFSKVAHVPSVGAALVVTDSVKGSSSNKTCEAAMNPVRLFHMPDAASYSLQTLFGAVDSHNNSQHWREA